MSFLYSLLLMLLCPTSLCALLLLAAVVSRKRPKLGRFCFWAAFAVLMICGNGWLVGGLSKHLEWQYLPPDPSPSADCILVLGGGTLSMIPPRPTIEVDESGDRVLQAAYLYRQGKAPRVYCIAGIAAGGQGTRPAAEDMADFLETLGVASDVILTKTSTGTDRELAHDLYPLLQQRKFNRVLLVTSALQMPRAIAILRRSCSGVEFFPAPADFRVTDSKPKLWPAQVAALIPTPRHLSDFSEAMHEYLAIAYYKLRAWM